MTILDEQPAPVHADGDVWAEIIEETAEPRLRALFIARREQGMPRLRALFIARREQGIARYGVPLQRENGRDHSADAVQELVDAVVYFRAAGRRKAQSLTETILIYVLNGHDMGGG